MVEELAEQGEQRVVGRGVADVGRDVRDQDGVAVHLDAQLVQEIGQGRLGHRDGLRRCLCSGKGVLGSVQSRGLGKHRIIGGSYRRGRNADLHQRGINDGLHAVHGLLGEVDGSDRLRVALALLGEATERSLRVNQCLLERGDVFQGRLISGLSLRC